MAGNLITQDCIGAQIISEKKKVVRVNAAIFFDGTGNNETNVAEGARDRQSYENGKSYKADFTNIVHLKNAWSQSKKHDISVHTYAEGVGTENGGEDSTVSAATGMSVLWAGVNKADGVHKKSNQQGVKAKVANAINEIIEQIVYQMGDADKIEGIDVDLFGFSRGAATARYCIYLLEHDLVNQLEASGYQARNLTINFVGLFDTVASYGVKHSNDTSDLQLDSIQSARFVLQLAAADEHRKNFRLTNIKSAFSGLEVFLPGVHSDIGGGYNAGNENDEDSDTNENDEEFFDLDTKNAFISHDEKAALSREREWGIRTGWYKQEEIKQPNMFNEILVTRAGIENTYARIPLNIMAEYALGYDVLLKKTKLLQVPTELEKWYVKLKEFAAKEGSSPDDWINKPDKLKDGQLYMSEGDKELQDLRHRYLHFSAWFGTAAGAHAPQFTDNDIISGVRRRIIQDG